LNYVIIGNSVAAVHAVEGIRERDNEGTITIISGEQFLAYNRPLISYWLEHKIDDRGMAYRSEVFYRTHKVEVIEGKRAVQIDPDSRQVRLDDGQTVAYDRLLLATGGRPFVPPIEGLPSTDLFTFNTWDDVRGLAEAATPDREAVVLGAGPTGLKAMESLVNIGVKVTLVEQSAQIWPQVLDPFAGRLVKSVLTDRGVRVILGDTMNGATRENNGRLRLGLQSGVELLCDFLVAATGIRPNVELVQDLPGVTINRGVVVDENLGIGLPGCFAAGDVVAGNAPILPLAAIQGHLAGLNMAGAREVFCPVSPFNAMNLWGLHIASMGCSASVPEKGYAILSEHNEAALTYRKLVLKGPHLVGGLFLNSPEQAGIYRHFMEERIDTNRFKQELLRPALGLLDLPPDLLNEKLAQ